MLLWGKPGSEGPLDVKGVLRWRQSESFFSCEMTLITIGIFQKNLRVSEKTSLDHEVSSFRLVNAEMCGDN